MSEYFSLKKTTKYNISSNYVEVRMAYQDPIIFDLIPRDYYYYRYNTGSGYEYRKSTLLSTEFHYKPADKQPSTDACPIGSIWFNTTNNTMYLLVQDVGGIHWQATTFSPFTENGVAYKEFSTGKLYRIYADNIPRLVYAKADVTLNVGGVGTQTYTLTSDEIYAASSQHSVTPPAYTTAFAGTRINATVKYYDGASQQVYVEDGLQYDDDILDVYGVCTDSVSTYVNFTISIQKNDTYLMVNDSEVSLICDISPTNNKSRSMFYPINSSDWRKVCHCTIYVMDDNDTTITFGHVEYLASQGYLTIANEEYSFNHFNITVRFKKAYKYKFMASSLFANDANTWGVDNSSHSSSFKVYAKPQPKMNITSVIPTIPAASGVGADGLAPYNVTVTDVTDVSGIYKFIKTITWDMGDSGSLDNIYTFDVEGQSSTEYHKVIQHLYEGYTKRSIRLTYTALNDIEYSGSVTFSPTQTQRIVIPSTVTVQGTAYPASATIRDAGSSPAQIICKAYPAGNPLPYVEWTVNVDSAVSTHASQFQMVKDGEWAEMSLPTAFGTATQRGYGVKCEVWKDETKSELIGSYTPENWSLYTTLNTDIYALETVSDADIYSHLLPQDNGSVWVYDVAQRIDKVYPARIQYCESWSENDYVEFDLDSTYQYLAHLVPGCVISVGYQGYARMMVVDEYNENDLTVTIVARDAASAAMSSRVATVSTHSTTGNGYDYQITPAESMLRYFPASQITTTDRAIPNFRIVCKDKERGGKCVYSARYENIMDIVKEVCSDSGLGYSSAMYNETPSVCMWIREGRDLTAGTGRVVFEEKRYKTARVGNYRQFTSVNTAVTAGVGIGNTRDYQVYYERSNSQYAVLDYLQSDRSLHQYICPNKKLMTDSVFTIEYSLLSADNVYIAGDRRFSLKQGINVTSSDGNLYFKFFRDSSTSEFYNVVASGVTTNEKHKLIINLENNTTIHDGSAPMSFPSDIAMPSRNYYLFAIDNDSWGMYGSVKIHSVKQVDAGVTVLDLVPVRRLADDVLGMYDKVTGSFFTNQGSGTFTAGAETGEYIGGGYSGISRREVFVDAGDSADADEQRRMGLLELIDAKQNSITVYPNLHNPSCVFGSDYKVGDKVNIVTRSGLELQKVITTARVSKDSTGVNLTLECGDDLKGYRYMIRQNKLQNAYARK